MNKFDQIFNFLDNKKFQTKLRVFNIFICFVSLIYIWILINESFDTSISFQQINTLELGILIIIYLIIGLTWVKFSNQNNTKESKKIFWNWSFSNLGKYFPGGIGLLSLRLNQVEEQRSSKKILFGLFEEQFIGAIISLPVLMFLLPLVNNQHILLFFAFTQFLFIFVFKKIYFFNKKISNVSLLNFPFLLLTSTLGTNFLTILIFYNYGFNEYILQAFYYLIATYLGLLFVGVPAGIGIREAIFIFLIGTSSTITQQIEVIIYIRALYFITDVSLGMIGLIGKFKG